jgi:hypothetical protein
MENCCAKMRNAAEEADKPLLIQFFSTSADGSLLDSVFYGRPYNGLHYF